MTAPSPHFNHVYDEGMFHNLGPNRATLSYPARRLLNAGRILPGSTDRSVAHGAPVAVIQAFAQRLTQAGNPYGSNDRITVAEALHAYTVGSARATGWGHKQGTLASGYLADLVVLGAHPLHVDVAEVAQIPIVAPMVGGVIEYGQLDAH